MKLFSARNRSLLAVPMAGAIAASALASTAVVEPIAQASLPPSFATLQPLKVDSLGNPLAGAEFDSEFCAQFPGALEVTCTIDYKFVSDADGKLQEKTSGGPNNTPLEIVDVRGGQHYAAYRETSTPEGYVSSGTTAVFADSNTQEAWIVEPLRGSFDTLVKLEPIAWDKPFNIVNYKKFGTLSAVKVDQNGTKLAGGEFTVEICTGAGEGQTCRNEDGTFTSDRTGVIRNEAGKSLSEAIYNPSTQPMRISLTETQAPAGATLATAPTVFTFTPDVGWKNAEGATLEGFAPTGEVANQTVPFTLLKTDQAGNTLSGAKADIEVCSKTLPTDAWSCTTHAGQDITPDGQAAARLVNYSLAPLWKVTAQEVQAPQGFQLSTDTYGPFTYSPKGGWSEDMVKIVNEPIPTTVSTTVTTTVTPTVTVTSTPDVTATHKTEQTVVVPSTTVITNTVEVTNVNNVVETSVVPTTLTVNETKTVTLVNTVNETATVNETNLTVITNTAVVPVTTVVTDTVEVTNVNNVVETSVVPTTLTMFDTRTVTSVDTVNETATVNETNLTVVTDTTVVPVTSTALATTVVEKPVVALTTTTVNESVTRTLTNTATETVVSEVPVTVIIPVTKLTEKTVEVTSVSGILSTVVVAATTTEVVRSTETVRPDTSTVTVTAPAVTSTRTVNIQTAGLLGQNTVQNLTQGMQGDLLPLIGGSLALGSLAAGTAFVGGGLNAESLGGNTGKIVLPVAQTNGSAAGSNK